MSCPSGDLSKCKCDLKATSSPHMVAQTINRHLTEGTIFNKVDLFAVTSPVASRSLSTTHVVADSSFEPIEFLPKIDNFRALADTSPYIAITLPNGQNANLKRVDLISRDFSIRTSSGETYDLKQIDSGTHYQGTLAGVDNSIVSLSVYNHGVSIGLVSSDTGNLTLGPFPGVNPDNRHVFYKENQQQLFQGYRCDTPESKSPPPPAALTHEVKVKEKSESSELSKPSESSGSTEVREKAESPTEASARCIRFYYETDYDLYQNQGSVANVTSFLTGAFNQVSTLYNNESVPIQISQIYIWNTPSPYAPYSTTTDMLTQFQTTRKSFNGDLGTLIALRGNGGVAASLSGLCSSDRSQAQCFCGIYASFANYPTYSWTVEVMAHECGHLNFLHHTHGCVWNGNNTAIDGCAGYTEGGCPLPGLPSQGGTIMSYCHLTSVGINFSLGFGPQPGNLLRQIYQNAACLQVCGGGTPVISLSPTSLAFQAVVGQSNPAAQSVKIVNAGSGVLNWIATIASNSSWLSVSPATGTAPATVSTSVNITGLSVGVYKSTITFSASGGGVSSQILPVTLTLTASTPVLIIQPTTLSFSATQGGSSPPSQTLTLKNSATSTLTWTATDNAPWLSVSPTSGSIGSSSTTASVAVNTSGLVAGSYTANITFSGNAPSVTIPVNLTVSSTTACPGGTLVTGTLSWVGARQYAPVYRTTQPGVHQATLTVPSGASFQMGLLEWKWDVNQWVQVASGTSTLTYNGDAGDYCYYVQSAAGQGAYTLCELMPAGSQLVVSKRREETIPNPFSHLQYDM